MTRFQSSIIFRGRCVALSNYQGSNKDGKLIFWNKYDLLEYVILNTDGYEWPAIFDTHRVLVNDYWLPFHSHIFKLKFEDLANWRDKQIDSILED